MIKPYFEAIRILKDADKGAEYEVEITMLFACIERIEKPAPLDDDFENEGPKVVLWLDNGTTPWLLMPYEQMRDMWTKWLDAASNIQSVFTNN